MNFRAAFAGLFCVSLFACGPNGGDVHAGEHSVVAPDHSYRVWYLAPPWNFVSATGDHAVIQIPAADNPHVVATIRGAVTKLTVDVVTQPPATIFAAAQASATAAQDWQIYAPRAITLAQGVAAQEIAFGGFTHVVRVVAAPIAGGRTLVLAFESVAAIDNDPEVTAMIQETETTGIGP